MSDYPIHPELEGPTAQERQTQVTYHRDPEDPNIVVITHPAPFEQIQSAETARNDAMVVFPAGEYRIRPVTIGGINTSVEKAYWFLPADRYTGVLKSGGFSDETPGQTTRTFRCQAYGYDVRRKLEEGS